MKALSWRDLKLIPELSHLTMFDFMNKEFDYLVNPFLYTLGIELALGIEYRVCNHRCLDGQAVVGLQIVGEIRLDREFMNSPWSTAEDKLCAASRGDRSLGNELSGLMGVQVDYGSTFAIDSEELKEHWMSEEEISKIEDEMEALEKVLKDVRGDQRKRDGGLRAPKDYWEAEPYEKVRKKKKDRSTLKHRELS